jgi:hypothetical protein
VPTMNLARQFLDPKQNGGKTLALRRASCGRWQSDPLSNLLQRRTGGE